VTFEEYVGSRGPALVRLARLLTGDAHRAEDLTQEVLSQAYVHWRRISRADRPDVYVRRMLVNANNSWWGRRSNREVVVEAVTDRPHRGDVGGEAADRDEMWRLILGLPDRQRAVLVDVAGPGPQTFDGTIHPTTDGASGMVTSWRPAPGLYARAVILHGDRAGLEQAVRVLRWNEARSCAVPLRLGSLPDGAPISSCSVDVSSYPRLVTSDFTLARAATQVMFVNYRYASGAGTRTEGNRTIGGRPANLSADGTTLDLLGIRRTVVSANFGCQWDGPLPAGVEPGATSGFTETDATTVLAGARVVEDPTRPQSWK
jgi:hypothetical protein